MRKNKFVYTLSALMMACIVSFSGIGNSYIQAHATSVGIEPGVWNDDASAWENIRQYLQLFASAIGIYISPSVSSVLWGIDAHNDFYNFMTSDGYSEEEANECVHGGGGHVRDGISVDDDGNVTYSDEVSDLFHGYIVKMLNESCGYWILRTLKPEEIPASYFTKAEYYQNFKDSMEILDIVLFYRKSSKNYLGYIPTEHVYTPDNQKDVFSSLTGIRYYYGEHGDESFSSYVYFEVLEPDWSHHKPYCIVAQSEVHVFDSIVDLISTGGISSGFVSERKLYQNDGSFFSGIVSKDGRDIKVWYDLSAFKNYSVGHQPYYVTQNWTNYNSADDNSITMTQQEYQYYTDNSNSLYETIQNNIDNSSETITENIVQNIVNNTYNQFIEESKGSGSGEDSGGNGITDLFDGIGKIFDTILSLIGRLMGVVADFTQSILDLFSGFTTFTDGFSQFLAGAFGFIPAEIWNVIQVGLSLMVLAAIIKFLRK